MQDKKWERSPTDTVSVSLSLKESTVYKIKKMYLYSHNLRPTGRCVLPQEAQTAESALLLHHLSQAVTRQGVYEEVYLVCWACWAGCCIQNLVENFLRLFDLDMCCPCLSLGYKQEKNIKPELISFCKEAITSVILHLGTSLSIQTFSTYYANKQKALPSTLAKKAYKKKE